ncbi:S-(hydroxymethyl)glutathione synthase [Pseudomonas sp. Os17]|nr:S-(hydroxymethyl)glutathione synthase [Pseudomonas sp. Os17]
MTASLYRGGCLCGQIRFEARGPAANPHTCSCKLCQRHSGALTLAWVEFPSTQVTWTGPAGAPATFRSSDYSSRAFCRACGSSLGAIDDQPTIALLLGCFDDNRAPALMPTHHSFSDRWPDGWQPTSQPPLNAGQQPVAPEAEQALDSAAPTQYKGPPHE